MATMHDTITAVSGLRVGHWSDLDGATGCTVVLCPPEGAVAACAVLGGAPGTRETDVLTPGNLVERVHAVLLTGGSAFGLDAAAGVMRWLEERQIGYQLRHAVVPIVPAAVLYDLGIGHAAARPDAAAGYAACQAAGEQVDEGCTGAGTGATVAKLQGPGHAVKSGLGTAAERLTGGGIVGALVAVNAIGEIVDPASGTVIAGLRGAEGSALDAVEFLRTRRSEPPAVVENTTIAVIATNIALTRDQLRRVALMAHMGIARTIRPSHTPADGDSVFAISTGELAEEPVDLVAIGALAARALERAVLRGVRAATPLAGVMPAGGPVTVRDCEPADAPWVDALCVREWGAAEVVSRGVLHRPSVLPGLIAERNGQASGLLTLHVSGGACEIVTLNSLVERNGVGTVLLEAAEARAREMGCHRMWLITTNDNTRALRFYQRRGWQVAAIHRDAVTAARRVKPEIPLTGSDGIPLRDEIELERLL